MSARPATPRPVSAAPVTLKLPALRRASAARSRRSMRRARGLLGAQLLLDRRDRVDQLDPPLLGRGAPLLVEQLERPEVTIEQPLGPTQALEVAVAGEGRLVGLDDRQQHLRPRRRIPGFVGI
jgi:hypothetical protein